MDYLGLNKIHFVVAIPCWHVNNAQVLNQPKGIFMSKMFVFAAAVTLLTLTACNSTKQHSAPAAAVQPAPVAVAPAVEAAPKAAEPVVAKPAEPAVVKAAEPVASKPAEPVVAKAAEPVASKPAEPVVAKAAEPVVAAKPVEASPKADVQAAASEVKPAAPAAKPQAPVAKPAASAAAKSDVITKEQAVALGGKNNCFTCHKIEAKVVGPAWKDVGAKYKADANAAGTIAAHIKSGGSFGWKMGNMPPRGGSSIKDADVDSLAKFIASLK